MSRSQRNINLPSKQKVLQIVKDYPGLTTSQIARYLPMSFPSTQRCLQEFEGLYLIHHRRQKLDITKITQIWFVGKSPLTDLVTTNVDAKLDQPSKVIVDKVANPNPGKLFSLVSD